jgi:hypothetical protein
MRAKQLITSVAICCVAIAQFSSINTAHSERADSAATASHSDNPRNRSKLLKHDRLRLVEAQAQGKKEVTLLIASTAGSNANVLRLVASLGGSVYYRDDDVSYLRVKLPTENVERLALSADIESLNIDGSIDYLNSPPPETSRDVSNQNRTLPPNRDTPAENPYLPSRDMGAPQFVREHPTFDGRGVTIAIIDASIDILSPELQTAKKLDGRPTPKFADILTAEREAIVPSYDNGHISGYVGINMEKQMAPRDGKLTHQGVTYTVPAQATFRIGILDERMDNPTEDLNRDGNPAGSDGLYAVLWDEKTNTVWVDTNQNYNFVDEKPMTDYRVNNDIGIFGKDDPATLIRETIGFAVQTDPAHKVVYILPGYTAHGTGSAGVAAGKNFFGGQISGAAPEAQIVAVPFGGPRRKVTPSVIESIIVAAKHPQVDLVTVQVGFVTPLNDGGSTLSVICNRLIEKYKKLIFKGAGNVSGDMVNSVGDCAAASRVIAVGSYISKETARTNYGVVTANEDNIDAFSARGPSKNGGFKPNILAPTMSLTTKPGFLPGSSYGTYDLPPGYQVGGGTSTSTPMAAGAAALLISAAKQSGVKYDADRLRWAIMSGARYLQNYGAYEQGPGSFQIGAAWKALASAPELIEITSRAPVSAALSQYLKTPNRGVGLFEREGWSVGQSGQRAIVFTRTSGRRNPITFRLRWHGNDGTFTSGSTVSLPLNSPVTIPITIRAETTGVHSGILNLDVEGGAPAVYQVMNTIVVANQFSADREFKITDNAQADWMEHASWYLNVPVGTEALKVDVTIDRGNVIPLLMSPSGVLYWELARRPAPPTGYQEAGSWSRIIPRPEAGVWQLVVANKNTDGQVRLASRNRAGFKVNIAALSVEPKPAAIVIDQSAIGASSSGEITFTNRLGSFTGGVASSPLGSAFTARPSLTRGGPPKVYEINVNPGSASISARINAASDTHSDLDLYLFDCTGKECVLKDFSQKDGSDEQVEVENPAAGKWKVVIDPFFVPSGKTTCKYEDFFTNSVFGLISPVGEPSLHTSGSTWKERVNIQLRNAPVSPRQLAALVAVTTDVGPNTIDQKPSGGLQVGYPRRVVLGAKRIEMKNQPR